MMSRSGVEQIRHLKRVLELMGRIQGELDIVADASRRTELNRRKRDNCDAFDQAVGQMISIANEDPHAWALLGLVDEDPDLDLKNLSGNLVRTAKIWARHFDTALAADGDGPVGEDFELDEL